MIRHHLFVFIQQDLCELRRLYFGAPPNSDLPCIELPSCSVANSLPPPQNASQDDEGYAQGCLEVRRRSADRRLLRSEEGARPPQRRSSARALPRRPSLTPTGARNPRRRPLLRPRPRRPPRPRPRSRPSDRPRPPRSPSEGLNKEKIDAAVLAFRKGPIDPITDKPVSQNDFAKRMRLTPSVFSKHLKKVAAGDVVEPPPSIAAGAAAAAKAQRRRSSGQGP